MPFRFVHTADLHLDSPLKSLALKNAGLAAQVRVATREALVAIVDLCLAEKVDALLIAGDLYDGGQTSMSTALFLSGELRRLDAAGIRVFLIRGNHDSQSVIRNELSLADSVHVFKARSTPVLAGSLANGRPVYVHGVSFAKATAPESLLPAFSAPMPDAVNIGMLHTSLAGAPGHDVYAPSSVADLVNFGFDYWALGHVHTRQVHSERPLVVMPGMPQGRDINEAGQKSVTLVTVHEDGTPSHEARATAVAVFERAVVDLDGVDDWRQMLDRVTAAMTTLRRAQPEGELILRLRLVGATPLAFRMRRDTDLLVTEITDRAAGVTGTWVEAVGIDCTAPSLPASPDGSDPVAELESLLSQDVLRDHGFAQDMASLVADFLTDLPPEARALLAPDEEAQRELGLEAARAGSAEILARFHAGSQAPGAAG